MQDSNVMQMLTLKVEGKKMIPKQHGKQEPKAVNDGRLIKEKKNQKKIQVGWAVVAARLDKKKPALISNATCCK